MANYLATGVIELEDANGDKDQIRLRREYADTATLATVHTDVAAIVTAIGNPGNVSNAKVVSAGASILWDTGVYSTTPVVPALGAEFSTVQDKAILSFANNNGAHRNVYLPAPIEAMFDAPPSDLVVNATYSGLATLLTALEGILSDESEGAFTALTGATYMGRRRHRNKGRG